MKHFVRLCAIGLIVTMIAIGASSCVTLTSAEDPKVYREHTLVVHKMDSGDICYTTDYLSTSAISCVAH